MTGNRAKRLRVGGALDRFAPVGLAVGAVLALVGLVYAFTVTPLVNGASVNGVEAINGVAVSNMLLLSPKIFYWHMPVAAVSFVAIAFGAYYAVRFLMTKDAAYDVRSKLCMGIGLVFVLCTMFTGLLWTRFEWGVWWTWEPRLTTYFILMLLVFGYFILRNAVADPERRAVYASVLSILILVDVPICLMVTRLIPSSVHPVVFRADSGMSFEMVLPILLSVVGFALVAIGLFRLRLRAQILEDRLTAVQEALED